MPIYEYICPECGETFERLKISRDDTDATCPECGGDAEVQISVSNFVMG